MSTQVQYRRGTNAQNAAFTGALAEITVDTTNGTLRVHDGITAGGSNIATVSYVTAQIGALSANSITNGTSSVAVIASGGNVRTNIAGATVQTISAGLVAITGDLSVTGNATLSGNILGDRIQNGTTTIDIQTPNGNANITVGATSNVAVFSTAGANITGTLGVTGNITGGNLSGTSIVGTLTTAAQTNITSVGTLGALAVTGNTSSGNFIGTLNGSGANVTSINANNISTGTLAQARLANAAVTLGSTALTLGATVTTVAGLSSVTSTTFVGALTGAATSATTAGTVTTAAQPNITSVGTLSSVTVTANVAGGNLTTAGQVVATGNITGGNLKTSGVTISSTGVSATTVTTTGNVSGGNVTTSGIFSGAGTGLTGTASSLTVGAATTAGTVTTAAQPNITSVGTLSSVTVTANVAGGNLTTAGQVVATGNVSGGNLVVTGNIIDSAALEIITGSNGNITLSPNGNGVIVASKDIRNGQANGVGNIGTVGGYFNTIFAKATSAQYADLAEMYVSDADYPPGTVVEFGGDKEVTISSVSHSTAVAGIVSTNPSYLMNSTQAGEHVLPIALTGRVPCQVQGPVRKGDVLVASATPGVAQRIGMNWQPGCVVGKSMEVIATAEIRTIEVAVGRL
jgi:hypothetical protein